MSTSRTYELKRRAERQEQTRDRIVEAAIELHTTLGPSRTTVTAIAERAGVTRPTVYAHFPDDRSLFEACSGHVRTTVPPPDPAAWRSIPDPGKRLEPLLENVQRDAAVMPIVAEMNAYRVRYLEEVRDVLVDAWAARGGARARLGRATGHALEFRTWHSLVRSQGCRPAEAVQLMVAFVAAVALIRTGHPGAPSSAGSRTVGGEHIKPD